MRRVRHTRHDVARQTVTIHVYDRNTGHDVPENPADEIIGTTCTLVGEVQFLLGKLMSKYGRVRVRGRAGGRGGGGGARRSRSVLCRRRPAGSRISRAAR